MGFSGRAPTCVNVNSLPPYGALGIGGVKWLRSKEAARLVVWLALIQIVELVIQIADWRLGWVGRACPVALSSTTV